MLQHLEVYQIFFISGKWTKNLKIREKRKKNDEKRAAGKKMLLLNLKVSNKTRTRPTHFAWLSIFWCYECFYKVKYVARKSLSWLN